MIHSGSRNIGLKVANHYNKIAQYWNEKWYSKMVSGLAYLPMETQMAKDYFREMNYCVAFAFANRQLMMTRICEAIQAVKPTLQAKVIMTSNAGAQAIVEPKQLGRITSIRM